MHKIVIVFYMNKTTMSWKYIDFDVYPLIKQKIIHLYYKFTILLIFFVTGYGLFKKNVV